LQGHSEQVLADTDGTSATFPVRSSLDIVNKGYNNHTYQTVFNLKVAGFTTHAFNAEYTLLTTNFVSYTGE